MEDSTKREMEAGTLDKDRRIRREFYVKFQHSERESYQKHGLQIPTAALAA